MPGFLNNIPQPNDDLAVSQGNILLNFQSCNISFGIDHYPFTDLTANDGKHNQVTTPIISPNAYPATAAAEPKLFAFAETQAGSTLPLGALQYSRGPSSAVPSPLTTIQSPVLPITLAAGATTNIIDFTGLTNCQFVVYAAPVNATNPNTGTSAATGLYWIIINPPAPNTKRIKILDMNAQAGFFIDGGNGILQLKNITSGTLNFVWTLQIIRIAQ